MAKAYSIVVYQQITDTDRFARYAELAGPALEAQGARYLARGMPDVVLEAGKSERVVIIEFASVEAAQAAYNCAAYAEALDVLGDAAVRDYRIIQGA